MLKLQEQRMKRIQDVLFCFNFCSSACQPDARWVLSVLLLLLLQLKLMNCEHLAVPGKRQAPQQDPAGLLAAHPSAHRGVWVCPGARAGSVLAASTEEQAGVVRNQVLGPFQGLSFRYYSDR